MSRYRLVVVKAVMMIKKGSISSKIVFRVHLSAAYGAVVTLLTGLSCLISWMETGTDVAGLADTATVFATMLARAPVS